MSEVKRGPVFEEPEAPAKKPYERPEVVYEARLEVQAGTPLRIPPDPFDLPFDLEGIFGFSP